MNNSVQNIDMNLLSLSLTMLYRMPHNFTMCLKNNLAVNSAKYTLGVRTNVVYFENQSMITKMTLYLPTFERCVMKSSDTLSHGLIGTSRGSRSPNTLAFSTLSYWQMRRLCILHYVIPHVWIKVPFLDQDIIDIYINDNDIK